MKKLLLILIGAASLVTAHGQKISDLTETTVVDTNDFLYLVKPSGTNFLSRKIQSTNLFFGLRTNLTQIITNITATQISASNTVTITNFVLVELPSTDQTNHVSWLISNRTLYFTNYTARGGVTNLVLVELPSTNQTNHVTYLINNQTLYWTNYARTNLDVGAAGGGYVAITNGEAINLTVTNLIVKDVSGITSMNGRNLLNSSSQATVNWQSSILSSGTENTVEWSAYILKTNGVVSLDWSQRALKNSSGVTTLNWQNKTMAGGWTYTGGQFDAVALSDASFSNPYSISNVTASAASVTNYTVSFTNAEPHIFTANTNANLILTNFVAGKSMNVWVDAITSSVPCVVTIPADLLTNQSLTLTATNGTLRVYNFTSIDGTSTNVTVCDTVFAR